MSIPNVATFIMPIQLTVDTREAKLLECLKSELGEDADILVAPLEIGDVEILHTEPDFRIVIERKTERDLSASLRDGRYHEQKARILATIPAHHCIYLIENPHRPTWAPNAYANCAPAAYSGAIIHTMFRDKMHVAITNGVSDTASWIATIYGKCRDNPSKFVVATNTGETSSYISCAKIKTKKSDNVDPLTCYQLQLGQIPGVSSKLAKAISEVYPSWREFFKALTTELDTEGKDGCIRLLSQIPLIGRKKADVIFEYVMGS